MKTHNFYAVLVMFTMMTCATQLTAQIEVEYDSNVAAPHIKLIETDAGNAFSRLMFQNQNKGNWTIAARDGSSADFNIFYSSDGSTGRNVINLDETDRAINIDGNFKLFRSDLPGEDNITMTKRQLLIYGDDLTNGGAPIQLVQLGDSGAGARDEGTLWLRTDRANVAETGIFMQADMNNGGQIDLHDGDQRQSAFLRAEQSGAARLHLEGSNAATIGTDGIADHLIALVNDKTSISTSDDESFYIGIWDDYTTSVFTEEAISFAFKTGGGQPNNSNIVSKIDQFGNYQLVSDMRLKENIHTLENVLPSILSMSPSSYNFKKNDNKTSEIGFIAQDVKKYFPELVDGDDTVDGQYMMVNYQGMIPILTKAIQEQQDIIDAQNKRFDAINTELTEIKNMLKAKK